MKRDSALNLKTDPTTLPTARVPRPPAVVDAESNGGRWTTALPLSDPLGQPANIGAADVVLVRSSHQPDWRQNSSRWAIPVAARAAVVATEAEPEADPTVDLRPGRQGGASVTAGAGPAFASPAQSLGRTTVPSDSRPSVSIKPRFKRAAATGEQQRGTSAGEPQHRPALRESRLTLGAKDSSIAGDISPALRVQRGDRGGGGGLRGRRNGLEGRPESHAPVSGSLSSTIAAGGAGGADGTGSGIGGSGIGSRARPKNSLPAAEDSEQPGVSP